MNNANIDKAKATDFENGMEWKAKMFHDFDGKTLDLKTVGIMAKHDTLKNNCWLAVAHLIRDRLQILVGQHQFERYLRPDFHTKFS